MCKLCSNPSTNLSLILHFQYIIAYGIPSDGETHIIEQHYKDLLTPFGVVPGVLFLSFSEFPPSSLNEACIDTFLPQAIISMAFGNTPAVFAFRMQVTFFRGITFCNTSTFILSSKTSHCGGSFHPDHFFMCNINKERMEIPASH